MKFLKSSFLVKLKNVKHIKFSGCSYRVDGLYKLHKIFNFLTRCEKWSENNGLCIKKLELFGKRQAYVKSLSDLGFGFNIGLWVLFPRISQGFFMQNPLSLDHFSHLVKKLNISCSCYSPTIL